MSRTKSKSNAQTAHRTVAEVVEQYVLQAGPSTRRDIANGTGRYLSSVCGAVHKLVEAGVLTYAGSTYDPETHRDVELLAHRNRPSGAQILAQLH